MNYVSIQGNTQSLMWPCPWAGHRGAAEGPPLVPGLEVMASQAVQSSSEALAVRLPAGVPCTRAPRSLVPCWFLPGACSQPLEAVSPLAVHSVAVCFLPGGSRDISHVLDLPCFKRLTSFVIGQRKMLCY